MAAGRIINRALLQQVGDLINVEGVKRFPSTLDLSDIKAVLDLTPFLYQAPPVTPIPGFASPTFQTNANHTGNFPANTLSVGVDLVGSSAVASLVIANDRPTFAQTAGVESRVMSINANLGYTPGAAAADVNALMIAMIQLFDTNGDLAFAIQEEFCIIENVSPYFFNWTFPSGRRKPFAAAATYQSAGAGGQWDGYVPPGWACAFHITRNAGAGFFPNGGATLVSLDTYFHVAQRPAQGDWKP